MKTTVLILALAAGLTSAAQPVRADDAAAVPGAGFPASRYEALWTKSPFAVATPEISADSSPDYFLVGISSFDGISYASVVETKTPQEHFLISSDKPTRGLTLTSITRGHDGGDTYAIVQKNGQSITLKLEQPPPTPAVPGALTPNMPVPGMTPQIFVPGAGAPTFPGAGSTRPLPARFHRPIIHLPPPPGEQQQAAPATATPPPSQ